MASSRLSLACRAAGDSVEPTCQLFLVCDRASLASQYQKGRLKGILGRVMVAQHAPTYSQHHGPVPLDQRRKRRLSAFVAAGDEPFKQLLVALMADRAALKQRVQMSQNLARRRSGHPADLQVSASFALYL
jgi:hypothetical protein